ncbi:MAG: hypothetical protein HQM08_15545 [Candidatus Riflebacteria bacterium]|nr:hypothetical protein [Candidatus Riflebacteria bacterium]
MINSFLSKKFKNASSGSAYLIALGVLGVLCIISFAISKGTITGRWATIFSNNDKKAEECAEACANLTYRIIQENMNDTEQFYKALLHPANFFANWYTQFRIPTVIAGAYMDPVQAKNSKNSAVENGVDMELDLMDNELYKKIYGDGITYEYVFPQDLTNSQTANSPLMVLDKMLSDMGGRTSLKVKARISKAFGILAKNPDYEIGGVTVPLTGLTGFFAKLINDINSDNLVFKFDLLQFIPNTNILNEIPKPVITVYFNIAGAPVPFPIPVPIGEILNMLGIGENLTWRNLAKGIIGDALSLDIDLNDLKKMIQEHVYKLLPEQFTFFKGNLSWGVTIEKQGLLETNIEVEFQPNFPENGPKIRKTLVTEKEFRVADIQPVAPDYSFFVANSARLFENPSVENNDKWEGNDQINLNDGDGALIIHNFPSFQSIFESLKDILSLDLKELNRRINLPGLVRINGTRPMEINLSIADPYNVTDLRMMELAALLLDHEDGKKHKIVPTVEEVWYNPAGGEGWDWPFWGTFDSSQGFWLPLLIPRFAHTMLFGNNHLEVPLSLKVEGYLNKKFSHLKFLIVQIYIPPIPFIGFPGFGFAFPWPWYKNLVEPYGFCKYPPWESSEDPQKLWDPNNPGNFPANLYSPYQFVKKASYYYDSSNDFAADIENRSVIIDGEKVFICDGVTFVNDNLWLSSPLKVMGRGMIVAAGNIHLGADIKKCEYDRSGNPTIFSLIARNGAIVNRFNSLEINACCYADKGILNPTGSQLKIYGNLVVNKFPRKLCQGMVEVYYQSKHSRSSLLSMIRTIAKYDPLRYFVSVSAKYRKFNFPKAS